MDLNLRLPDPYVNRFPTKTKQKNPFVDDDVMKAELKRKRQTDKDNKDAG